MPRIGEITLPVPDLRDVVGLRTADTVERTDGEMVLSGR
jgi:hypothetical protein